MARSRADKTASGKLYPKGRINMRMQRSRLLARLALLALGMIGISGIVTALSTPDVSAAAAVQRVPLSWHAQAVAAGKPAGQVDGAFAQLRRTDSGISWTINTLGLTPGHAYTVWRVIINNTAACTADPCAPNPDVLVNTALTRSQIVYGGGHLAGQAGNASFGGSRNVGPVHNGWFGATGLENAMTAEIHLVLNDHGPKIAEFMPGMIDTYRSGCTDASLPGIFPASAKADGAPGPNTCTLWQAAIFQP